MINLLEKIFEYGLEKKEVYEQEAFTQLQDLLRKNPKECSPQLVEFIVQKTKLMGLNFNGLDQAMALNQFLSRISFNQVLGSSDEVLSIDHFSALCALSAYLMNYSAMTRVACAIDIQSLFSRMPKDHGTFMPYLMAVLRSGANPRNAEVLTGEAEKCWRSVFSDVLLDSKRDFLVKIIPQRMDKALAEMIALFFHQVAFSAVLSNSSDNLTQQQFSALGRFIDTCTSNEIHCPLSDFRVLPKVEVVTFGEGSVLERLEGVVGNSSRSDVRKLKDLFGELRSKPFHDDGKADGENNLCLQLCSIHQGLEEVATKAKAEDRSCLDQSWSEMCYSVLSMGPHKKIAEAVASIVQLYPQYSPFFFHNALVCVEDKDAFLLELRRALSKEGVGLDRAMMKDSVQTISRVERIATVGLSLTQYLDQEHSVSLKDTDIFQRVCFFAGTDSHVVGELTPLAMGDSLLGVTKKFLIKVGCLEKEAEEVERSVLGSKP